MINETSMMPYLLYDKPYPYDDIMIYPVKMGDILEFQIYQRCLVLRKNSWFPDKQIIKMTYMDFLFFCSNNPEYLNKFNDKNDEMFDFSDSSLYYFYFLQLLTIVCKESKEIKEIYRIEGEGMWSRFGQGKTGIRTYQMLGIMVYFFRLHIHHGKRTLSEIKGRHDGVLDTLLILLRRFETVDDQFDEVGLVSVQGSYFIEFEQFAIHPHLGVSSLAHLLEKFLVMAFTAFDYRRKKVAFASAVVLHDQ